MDHMLGFVTWAMYNVYVIIKILKHTLNIKLCIIKINFLSNLSMSSNNTPHHLNTICNEIFPKFRTYSLILFFSFTTEPISEPPKSVNVQFRLQDSPPSVQYWFPSLSQLLLHTYMTHVLISVGIFTFLFPTYFYKIKRSNAIKYSKNSTNKQCCIDQDGNNAKTELLVNRCIHLLRDKSRSAVWNAVHMGQYITNKCAGCMEVKDPCIQFY